MVRQWDQESIRPLPPVLDTAEKRFSYFRYAVQEAHTWNQVKPRRRTKDPESALVISEWTKGIKRRAL